MLVATMVRRSLELILLKSVDYKELTIKKDLSDCFGTVYAEQSGSIAEIPINVSVDLERTVHEGAFYAFLRILLGEPEEDLQIWCVWVNQETLELGVTQEPTIQFSSPLVWRIGTRDSFATVSQNKFFKR